MPLRAATEAARRELKAEGPVVLGCDVARFGHDKTVVVRRQGQVARIVWRVRGHDTMETVGFLKSYCDEHRIDSIVVDDTGVGGGVVDRLREVRPRGARVVAFKGGASPESDGYFMNRVGEVWWIMRQAYITGELDTDDDPALIGQVASREYKRESDGRIKLQSKYTMRKSPDEADALAMTFAVKRDRVRIWV